MSVGRGGREKTRPEGPESYQPRASPWVLCVQMCFRAVSAKAFGFAFVRHDSAISEQVRMALAAPSVAPVGRGFSCAILPRAMPWAMSLLALQAVFISTTPSLQEGTTLDALIVFSQHIA